MPAGGPGVLTEIREEHRVDGRLMADLGRIRQVSGRSAGWNGSSPTRPSSPTGTARLSVGDALQALGPDFGSGVPAFIVAGPALSGRPTILVTMARSFLAAGTHLVAVAPALTAVVTGRSPRGAARLHRG